MAKNKYDFIAELLERKGLNSTNRNRILKLATEEFKTDGDLNERLRKIEDVVFNNNSNTINPDNGQTIKEKKNLIGTKNGPHLPRDTANFLMEFKRDGSGLKELIHEPNNSVDLRRILELAQNSSYLSYDIFKTPTEHNACYGARKGALELFRKFEISGIPFWEKNGTFPFGTNGSKSYTDSGLNFKRNYRLGIAREGYSNLKSMLEDDSKKQLNSDVNIRFLPDDRIFDLRAHFYTWIPFMRSGIQQILSDCKQERINQNRDVQIIEYELTRNTEKRTRTLSITDVDSVGETPPDAFLNLKKVGSDMFKYLFRSLCDWSVEYYFELENKSYRINLLTPYNEYSKGNEIVDLETKPKGFTHFLTFYDAD